MSQLLRVTSLEMKTTGKMTMHFLQKLLNFQVPPKMVMRRLTLVVVMKEAMDEVIARGMPAQAARDFLLGHINIPLAIVFGEIEWDFSAGAKKMIEEAKKELLQPDWKKVFDLENVRRSVLKITEA